MCNCRFFKPNSHLIAMTVTYTTVALGSIVVSVLAIGLICFVEGMERGKLNCLLRFPSFIRCSACSLPRRSAARTVDPTIPGTPSEW
jgi:hypothetical protein